MKIDKVRKLNESKEKTMKIKNRKMSDGPIKEDCTVNESEETNKLYKAISDTVDAIDDLDDKNEQSAKKNLDRADNKINDVKGALKESLETGISATLMDLVNQEYQLLSSYESAQTTFEDNGDATFNEVFDYIKDDINIHIGMLQAAIDEINGSQEKIEDGKEQAELILDESLFEDVRNPATGKNRHITAKGQPSVKYDKDGRVTSINGKTVLQYDDKQNAFIVPSNMKDFWDEL